MILKRTTDPTEEPISVTEAKTHLRVDISDDDTLIEGLIQAARDYLESATRRAFCTQTWRLSLEDWPDKYEIEIPRPPLVSVTSLKYTDSAGTVTTLSSSLYTVDTDSEPGRFVLNYGESWPSVTLGTGTPIQLVYVAGYGGASAVPQWIKQAMYLLVGHWYENREATITGAGVLSNPIPFTLESLIWLRRV